MAEKIKWVKGIKTIIKMGMKPKSHANNTQSNQTYKLGGLIFQSKEAYENLKGIDFNASQMVDLIKDGSINIQEFFSRFPKVKVKELYSYASQDLYEIFENITALTLIKDRDYFETELDFAANFHSLIDIEFFDD